MKRTLTCKALSYFVLPLTLVAGLFYLALTADSFYREYVLDRFVYWGYPQWGWLYADAGTYLRFNIVYILFLVLCMVGGVWLWRAKRLKTAVVLLLLPPVTAAAFVYLPTYTWNRQFDIFNRDNVSGEDKSRIPAGKWWISKDQMQRYKDISGWEKAKGWFGRGEWPGGYTTWGEYRVWLLPDLLTDTKGRRGMVIHGGTRQGSPWGINLADNIVDLAIELRRSRGPLELNVRYDKTAEEKETDASDATLAPAEEKPQS